MTYLAMTALLYLCYLETKNGHQESDGRVQFVECQKSEFYTVYSPTDAKDIREPILGIINVTDTKVNNVLPQRNHRLSCGAVD